MDVTGPGGYNMKMARGILLLIAGLGLLVACNPDPRKPPGTDDDKTPRPVTADTPAELTAAVEEMFTTSCALSGCHSGSNPESGLSLEAARYLSDTVNQPSRQVATMMRLVRGEPDLSYLIHKIRGTHDTATVGGRGGRMPLRGSPLTLESIQTVEAWVRSLAFTADEDGDGSGVDVDCDDADPDIHPGAADITGNSVDEDCSGAPLDADGDGHTAIAEGGTDANDNDPTVNPDAPELCFDFLDNDQDGAEDEDCIADYDSDGHNSVAAGGDDLDDNDPSIYPGAPEICGDGKDNDQDDSVDENCDPNVDDDGDGETEIQGDCNDNNSAISTTATEVWGNLVDENCDAIIEDRDDDGVTATTIGGTDCNDLDPDIYTGAADIVDNGIDEDCDGLDDTAMNFTRVQNQIFVNCQNSGCHNGTDPAEGMNLTAGNSYDQIVNVNSVQVPSMKRIKPSDPQNSYMLRKLKNTHTAVGGYGMRMPKDQPALSSDDITRIQNWIAHGALE